MSTEHNALWTTSLSIQGKCHLSYLFLPVYPNLVPSCNNPFHRAHACDSSYTPPWRHHCRVCDCSFSNPCWFLCWGSSLPHDPSVDKVYREGPSAFLSQFCSFLTVQHLVSCYSLDSYDHPCCSKSKKKRLYIP